MMHFKIYKPVLLFFFDSLFCLSESLSNKESICVPESVSTSTVLRCGEVLTERSGYISYKPYQPIDSNERCVWTLGFTEQSRYDIDIQYMGFPNGNDTDSQPSLLISPLPLSSTVTQIPTSTGLLNLTTSTITIIFSSGELDSGNNFTGFILQYKRSSVSSGTQTQHRIQLPRVMLNFTLNGVGFYGTIILPPQNNTYPGTPYPMIYMEYGTTTCNSLCQTRINIYHFDRRSPTFPWKSVDSLCCRQQSAIIPGNDDLWMITIWSSENGVRKDFIFFNERCHQNNFNRI